MPARILIVEDNPDNLKLMTYLLNASGYQLLSALDGHEAVELIIRERPDLIICDVQIPKMDGYEVARRLKAHPALRRIPLVAVTALAMVGDRDKMLAAGFDGYISKPIVPQAFAKQVEAFLPKKTRSAPESAKRFPASQNVPPVEGNLATVLVVDDSAVNISLVRSTLEPFGYRVVSAQNVREGLALARQSSPDLIVSDMHMPHQDGRDFIKAVKDDPQLRDIPFIFLSSTVWQTQDQQAGMDLGAKQFLMRPIHPEILLAKIKACFQGQKVH